MIPGLSSGGGMSIDGGTQQSDSSGGNGTINNGGVNIPTYPAAFGYPGAAPAAGLNITSLALIGLVGLVAWKALK